MLPLTIPQPVFNFASLQGPSLQNPIEVDTITHKGGKENVDDEGTLYASKIENRERQDG